MSNGGGAGDDDTCNTVPDAADKNDAEDKPDKKVVEAVAKDVKTEEKKHSELSAGTHSDHSYG